MKLCGLHIAPGENNVHGDLISPSRPLHQLASLAPFERRAIIKCSDEACTHYPVAVLDLPDAELLVDVGMYALKMAHSDSMERDTTVQGAMAWGMANELNVQVPAHRRCCGTTRRPLRDRTVDVPCQARMDVTIDTLADELPPIAIAEYATLIGEPAVQALLVEIVPEESLTVHVGSSSGRYDLVAVMYHLPDHFVSQFIYNGRAYYHDGMSNQGRPVDIGSRIDVGYGIRNNSPRAMYPLHSCVRSARRNYSSSIGGRGG
jgi:hypothetical protein